MKYAIVKIDGKEIPVIFGEGIDAGALNLPGDIIAAGTAKIHQITVSCEGTLMVGDKEIGSRALKDEILIRHYDHMQAEAEAQAHAERDAPVDDSDIAEDRETE